MVNAKIIMYVLRSSFWLGGHSDVDANLECVSYACVCFCIAQDEAEAELLTPSRIFPI